MLIRCKTYHFYDHYFNVKIIGKINNVKSRLIIEILSFKYKNIFNIYGLNEA
jgi:hypothetical protein